MLTSAPQLVAATRSAAESTDRDISATILAGWRATPRSKVQQYAAISVSSQFW
jgi:hypothetical protein